MTQRRRFLCYCMALMATTLSNFVVGYSIPQYSHYSRERIRVFSAENDDYEEAPSNNKRRRRIRPKRPTSTTTQSKIRQEEANQRYKQASQDPTLLSSVDFAERTDLNPQTKRALTETMGLRKMTEIQAKTYAEALKGKNIKARANTGTGKSLAFLLPCLERLMQGDVSLYHSNRNIGMLVLVPTRELAIQIANQARLLLTFHSSDYTVMSMYGGTKLSRDTTLLNKRLPTILIATPGRLLDHIQQTKLQRGLKFSDVLGKTPIVVLDEVDRLLEMGFAREILKILSYLPRRSKRQTLLFSATLPNRDKLQDILDDDYIQVDCSSGEKRKGASHKTDTNVTDNTTRVKQTFFVLPSMDTYVTSLIQVLLQVTESTNDFKILVFFPATKLVRFFTTIINSIDILPPIQELHSRMTQSKRQRVSSNFAQAKRAILFTSDVSARGVDYPDVTHVIQYGSADSKVTYTHRLGRTGRAGRSGEGLAVLLPFEASLETSLRKSGVNENTELVDIHSDDKKIQEELAPVYNKIRSGNIQFKSSAEDAYRAFLAYYMSRADRLNVSAETIVSSASEFAKSIGLSKLPSFTHKTAKKLQLVGIDGVSIDNE